MINATKIITSVIVAVPQSLPVRDLAAK